MDKFLRIFIYAGATFIAIVSLTHMTLGQSWLPDTTTVTASLDSEHRFYTSLFLMYGGALFWCGRDLSARRNVFHVLLLTLFVGGLARIPSVAVMGWPHPMFIVLGALELLLPPMLWAISRAAAQRGSEGSAKTPTTAPPQTSA